MDADDARIDALAETIRDYLNKHPNAADTLEGVATWWLSGNADAQWLSDVRCAMERLIERGNVARYTLRDGTVIYERRKKDVRS